jgi:hypothetical protein
MTRQIANVLLRIPIYGIRIDDGASGRTGGAQDPAPVGIISVRDSNSKVEKVYATTMDNTAWTRAHKCGGAAHRATLLGLATG